MRDLIIEKDSLRLDGNTLSVGVRMPWYRALPLSSVCDLVLDIDGMAINKESTHWLINGHNYREDELPPLYEDWWFVTDTATLSGTLSDEEVAADPAMQAALADYTAKYETKWLDMELPALRGMTPRQAADDPTRREDLIRLLAGMPRTDDPTKMDAGRLARALGLE